MSTSRRTKQFFTTRTWLWLVGLTAGLLLPLLPDGLMVSSAAADISSIDPLQLCSQAQGTCPAYPSPPPLISDASLANLSPADADGVRAMEDLAIRTTLKDHGLPETDYNAVESWGRTDAQATLWVLTLHAMETSADQRTPAQQAAVDWMGSLLGGLDDLTARWSGAEYAEWAGLDVDHYWRIAGSASQSELAQFLTSGVNPYSPTDPGDRHAGYCNYRPPAPDSGAYDGSQTPTCFAPCASVIGCDVPTPSFDQFFTWGQDAAINSTLTATPLQDQAIAISGALAAGSAVAGVGIASTVMALLSSDTLTTLATGLFPNMAADAFLDVAGTLAGVAEAVSAVASVVAIVIFATVTAVIEAVKVGSAATLPLTLAAAVASHRGGTADATAMLDTSDHQLVLFELFAGATMPLPRTDQNCERDYILSGQATGIGPGVTQYYALSTQPDELPPNAIVSSVPCLNPPAIPAPSPTDPQFVVTAQSSGTTQGDSGTPATPSSTISLENEKADYTSTVRLSGSWFVQQESKGGDVVNAQTLRLHYTDWAGDSKQVELVPTDGGGYQFVGVSVGSSANPSPIDVSTCESDGTCFRTSTIQYRGADGTNYSASVVAYAPPTGSPTYGHVSLNNQLPIEGSEAVFFANGFAPGNTVGTVSYSWEFQTSPCGPAVLCVQPSLAHYSDPQTGDTTFYTWQRPGKVWVRLTATDQVGHQAVDSFQATINDVTPTMQLTADCATSPAPCDNHSQSGGQVVTVSGSAHDAGTDDFENVAIQWGDGTSDTKAAGLGIVNLADPNLSFAQSTSDPHTFPFTATHGYASPGLYYGNVTVSDFDGATVNEPFTASVTGQAKVSFDALADHTYGDRFQLTATGSRSGQPVTYTAAPASVCTASGDDGATATMVGVGTCTITAHQAAAPPLFLAATPVTQTFAVKPAPLTITAKDAEKSYGDPNPAFTATYTGLVNGDTADAVGGVTLSGPSPDSDAGSYPIVPTIAGGASNPDYALTLKNGTLTVDPAHLTITADDQTRAYGQPNHFAATYDGLVNGDTPADLPPLSFSTDQGPTDKTGSYRITPGGIPVVQPNYHIGYVPGTLHVTPAPLTITADNQAKTYGGPDPTFTTTVTGLVNGDTLADLTGLTVTGAPTASNAGTYPITPAGAEDPNYDITYKPGSETIAKAPLTITADDQAKTYGGTDPTLTATFHGLVNGDTKANVAGLTLTGPASASSVGTYPIHPANAVNPNYAISYADGTETISPAPLGITADDKTKVYGAADPRFTATYHGLVNGDTASAIVGLTLTGAPTASHVGSYAIHAGGAVNSNYVISYTDGTERVTPAPLTITADPQTVASGKTTGYTWRGGGWVNGDSDATLAQSPHQQPSCQATVAGSAASATTPPGSYPSAITCTGALDTDYTVSYTAAKLTVDPVLTLTQTGLPSTAPAKVTLDSILRGLPVTRLEVGYNTSHSFSFPGVVVDSAGTIYTTTAAAFSGKVTANVAVNATYDGEIDLIQAGIASGAIATNGPSTALASNWKQVQADLKAGRTSAALTDLHTFASVIRAQSKKIAAATAALLLARAQLVYASLGGTGTV